MQSISVIFGRLLEGEVRRPDSSAARSSGDRSKSKLDRLHRRSWDPERKVESSEDKLAENEDRDRNAVANLLHPANNVAADVGSPGIHVVVAIPISLRCFYK